MFHCADFIHDGQDVTLIGAARRGAVVVCEALSGLVAEPVLDQRSSSLTPGQDCNDDWRGTGRS
jgi:hypothetical protein